MKSMDFESRRVQLYGLLGDLPPRDLPITSELLWEKDCEKYILQKMKLSLNGLESVNAYVTLPKKGKAPYPAVVFCHSHGGGYDIGKEEYINGRSYMYDIPYADDLSDAGFAGIAIDHWCFGERNTRTENDTFKDMLWHGQVMWGMMVYDSIRAVDYLCSREDIDTGRIAALGMSMGSTMAWWLAALDERIAVCADICCLTDFEELLTENGLKEHGIYYYVPSLLKYFSAAEINSLIAPRPHFSVNGRLDPLTPERGLHKIDEVLSALYTEMGVPENWHLRIDEVAHQETKEARADILAFLKHHLNMD